MKTLSLWLSIIVLISLSVNTLLLAEPPVLAKPDLETNNLTGSTYSEQSKEHMSQAKFMELFGEKVWNHSFERKISNDSLYAKLGAIETSPSNPKAKSIDFGNSTWSEYELRFQGCIKNGDGPLIVTVGSKDNYYSLLFGADGNYRHKLEHTVSVQGSQEYNSITVQSIDGYIDSGRYQNFRIIFLKNGIKAWIGGSPVLDFTSETIQNGGPISIKGGNTEALFRNFSIKSLNGKSLYFSFPTQASQWFALGRVFTDLDSDKLSDDKTSMKLYALSAESGIEQKYMCAHENELLMGTIRLQGNVPGGLTVRICDDEKIVTQNILPVSSKTWKELPLIMHIDKPVLNPKLQIVTLSKGCVWIDWISLKPAWVTDIKGFQTKAPVKNETHFNF